MRRHRARKRGLLAGTGGPDLFGFVPTPDVPPPKSPSPESAPAPASESRKRGPALAPRTDPDRPDVGRLIAFLRRLRVSQGRLAGKRLDVLPWQAEFLRGALAPGIYESSLTTARGNGKTCFVAAVLCACLAGPLRQPRGEVLLVASSFGQARIAFEFALYFLRPWFEDRPADWRVEDSSQRAAITHRPTGARVRCIASDPRRAHGLAPALAILDEPAQWPTNTAGRMLAAIRTASGKVPGSRRWMIGTRPVDEAHWFERALCGAGGPGTFAKRYAADPEGDPCSEAEWLAANPSLPAMPDLRDAIASEAEAARHDPMSLPAFRALRLNLGEPDESTALLLDAGTWEGIETEDSEPAGACVWGIDLSGGAAMNGFASYWPQSGRLESVAFFPAHPPLAERGRLDGVDRLYMRMAERGELGLSGEHAVDLPDILAQLRQRWGRPAAIVADNWRKDALREALRRAGFRGAGKLIFRGNGYRDGSQDLEAFRAAALNGTLKPVPSLLLRAGMREARISVDTSGNGKLAKQTQGGRRSKARDDAIAAAILAVAEGHRELARRAARRAA